MFKTNQTQAALKALIGALGVSALVVASPAAHAGPFDSLKKMVKKEAAKELDKASPKIAESALRAVIGGGSSDAEAPGEPGSPPVGKGRIIDTRDVTGDGIADIVLLMPDGSVKVIPGEAPAPQAAALQQAGHTTVETADEVQAPILETMGRPVEGDADYTTHAEESIDKSGRAKVSVANGKKPSSDPAAEMSQNQHTTVETADEVQAPTRPQRAKLSQNGTTVETASEVQAPERPARAGLSQNGHTTVETADEVQAPTHPQRGKLNQNGTTVETASEVQAPERPQR